MDGAHACRFLHSSVDVRNMVFKLAPVDTNSIRAAGTASPRNAAAGGAGSAGRHRENLPGGQNLLVIPENHARNMFYR